MLKDPISFLRDFADMHFETLVSLWVMPDGRVAKPGPETVTRVRMSPDIGKPIAQAYEAGQHDPQNPVVRASYMQLMGEMYCQYRFITETLAVTIEPFFGDGEPYENSTAMCEDVARNKHLYFLTTTEDAFGSATADIGDNWMGQPTGVRINGYDLLVNDMFRSVHDFFGHALPGTSFSATGEERAWYCHSRMCSPLARSALTTETRGQNTWVNFGPHMLDDAGNVRCEGASGWLAPRDRPFAEQKNMILPAHISGVQLNQDRTGAIRATSLPICKAPPEFA